MRQLARARADGADEGFTLVEFLVAMGIFSALMAVVTVTMVNGLKAVRTSSTNNTVQAQQQTTLIWLAELLHYVDNPLDPNNPVVPASPPAAILQATPTSMTFFTYSGSGPVDRMVYKVHVCTSTKGVETFIWSPTITNGVPADGVSTSTSIPTCDNAGATGSTRRLLIPTADGRTPSLALTYWRAHRAADGLGTADVQLVPTGTPAVLTATDLKDLNKVQVTLNDSLMNAPVTQTMLLVNDRKTS